MVGHWGAGVKTLSVGICDGAQSTVRSSLHLLFMRTHTKFGIKVFEMSLELKYNI